MARWGGGEWAQSHQYKLNIWKLAAEAFGGGGDKSDHPRSNIPPSFSEKRQGLFPSRQVAAPGAEVNKRDAAKRRLHARAWAQTPPHSMASSAKSTYPAGRLWGRGGGEGELCLGPRAASQAPLRRRPGPSPVALAWRRRGRPARSAPALPRGWLLFPARGRGGPSASLPRGLFHARAPSPHSARPGPATAATGGSRRGRGRARRRYRLPSPISGRRTLGSGDRSGSRGGKMAGVARLLALTGLRAERLRGTAAGRGQSAAERARGKAAAPGNKEAAAKGEGGGARALRRARAPL